MVKECKVRYELKESCIEFEVGEKTAVSIDRSKLLWCSERRPWSWEAGGEGQYQEIREDDELVCQWKQGGITAQGRLSREEGGLRIDLMFENGSEETISDFAGGISLPLCGRELYKVTIPHMIYNDNPSAAPDRVVPHIGKEPGKGLVVEEHRLPIPATNVEWKQDSVYYDMTLLSLPQVKTGVDQDYWALGVIREEDGYRILLSSGPLMFNGKKDVYYGGQCTPLPYGKGYRTLRPGEVLRKTCYLFWTCRGEEGRGYRSLTQLGYRMLKPCTKPVYSVQEMIALKKQVMDSRFYEDEDSIGYLTFGTANSFGNLSGRPEYYLYGWTGQAIRLAWCDCMLGIQEKEHTRLERGIRITDFFLKKAEQSVPGLFYGYYLIRQKSWRGFYDSPQAPHSSRILGESLSDVLDILFLLREHQLAIPDGWEAAVERACRFVLDPAHQTAQGLLPVTWDGNGRPISQEISAAGMSCVQLLARAAQYFPGSDYLDGASTLYARYAKLHMETFEIPFAGATLDAKCEDKEAGIYFFTTAARLYELTGESCYREWGMLSADWILTFVYHWNTGFYPGTPCAKQSFFSTGWPGVSVQNHHLDVFFPVYELYRFGKQCGEERLMRMAEHIRNALTQGIAAKPGDWGYSVVGEQGEQYYQTNYFQLRYPAILDHLDCYRGGMQRWNPLWITSQVLSCNLKFQYGELTQTERSL